ncbi:pyridoxamine 5'-phosphate oxidase family protein [soil metagenome]
MTAAHPVTSIDSRYGSPEAEPRAWSEGSAALESAEVYWITTVRADGRPHVTPLIGIWLDDAFYFCSGEDEQKTLNLTANNQVVVTTGCNKFNEGLDIVVEGSVQRPTDVGRLERLAAGYKTKYDWNYVVRDGAFYDSETAERSANVYEVVPSKIFGFGKGEPFSQTRWRFR